MALRLVVTPGIDNLIGERLEEYLLGLGERIAENARRTVPVKTGDLKESIVAQAKLDGSESILQVGVDPDVKGVDYSIFVEVGTSRQAAQPYLRPAVLQAGGRVA